MWRRYSFQYIPRITAITALICLIISLSYVNGSYAQGYEISIYEAYPYTFWASLIGVLFFGIVTLVLCSLTKEKCILVTFIGWIVIFAYYMIIIFLRTMRGYPFADPQDLNYQTSQLNDIIYSGHLGSTNFYPILNLFSESLRIVANLPQTWIADIVSLVTIIVFILSIYILAYSIHRESVPAIACSCFAAIPIFGYGYYYHPSINSALLIPLVLFLLHRVISTPSVKAAPYFLLLVLVIICEPLYHPMTSVMITILVLSLGLYRLITHVYHKKSHFFASISGVNYSIEVTIALILSLIMLIWCLGFAHIQGNIQIIYQTIIESDGISVYTSKADLINEAGLTLSQFFDLTINSYGALALYLLPALALLLIVVLSDNLRRYMVQNCQIGQYLFAFIIMSCFSFVMFFTQTAEANIIRVIRVPIILSTLLSGFTLTLVLTKYCRYNFSKVKRGFIFFGLIIFLLSVAYFSTFCFHPSPRISQPNYQVTQMELDATGWLFDNVLRSHDSEDSEIRVTYIPAYHIQKRFFSLSNYENGVIIRDKNFIPTHFGYNSQSTLYNTLGGRSTLLLTGKKDLVRKEAFPKSVWSKFKRIYDPDDFIRLNEDPTVNHIYCSNECSIYLV